MEYTVIRSGRRTLSMELRGRELVVRAPRWVSEEEIRSFVDQHRRWLQKALARQAQAQAAEPLTREELTELARAAREYIPRRVAFFAPLVGASYGKVTIRCQRTRWGSCSAKGNLSFNCLLMLAPAEVLDSVVVHELCHRKVMDHSDRFYREVLRVMPEYGERRRWLREKGAELLARAAK